MSLLGFVVKRIIYLLCFCFCLIWDQGYSADCSDASGTVTISTSCTQLEISGDGSNVTVAAGVTVDSSGTMAVKTPDAVNVTITNNGTITADGNYGIRNTSPGDIYSLTNNGSIIAGAGGTGNHGIRNGGTITSLSNSGTISAATDRGITNLGGPARSWGTVTNSGLISAGEDFGIRNDGTIDLINNSGQISAGGDNGVWSKGTLTSLINTGTISVGDTDGIKNVSGGIIGTINNSGTISAVSDYGIRNDATSTKFSSLETLINSGTISASRNAIWNDGEIDTLTNSGTIKTTSGDYGIKNVGGTIGTLTNSDTISAGGNWGIYNEGSATITTLTNTGTISASGNNIGIHNATSSTITTLNNLQGASGSALTYQGKLPTNYNVIVNSTTDFGKTIFSDVSGQTNFGVHSGSTLSEGTYSSVLSGLTASEIVSGTSGTVVSGAIRSNWALANNTGSEWDLVVGNKDITDDTKTSVVKSVKPNIVLGVNNLTSVTEVNFANMNTYDCDLFDKHKICVSFGGRHTVINSPKTKTNSMVLVGGYQVTDALRVGGFFHHNISHKTPASFKLSDKTPLLGGLVVWNEKPNRLGYQLKLANAFQQKYAAVTREVVGSSEEGKGQTVIEAKSFVAELQYGYQFNDNIILRPYFAARSAVIKQDAYTERGSSSPLSFNEIKDKSTTILPGLKLNARLSSNLSLKGSFGIEHDVHHSIDKLAPTGISGLSTVSLSDDFNQNRPVASLGFDYFFKSNHRVSFVAQYQELAYKSKTETNAYVYYTIGF